MNADFAGSSVWESEQGVNWFPRHDGYQISIADDIIFRDEWYRLKL